jgi:hypothetical protein
VANWVASSARFAAPLCCLCSNEFNPLMQQLPGVVALLVSLC